MRTSYMVKRGMVFWYCNSDLTTKRTSVQKYRRPYIVVSCDEGNLSSPTCNLVPCTTEDKTSIPTHVSLYFNSQSNTALCEQVITVDQNVLNKESNTFICFLTDRDMKKISEALAVQFSVEPQIRYEDITINNLSEKLEVLIGDLIKEKVQYQHQLVSKETLEDSALRLGQMIEDLVGNAEHSSPEHIETTSNLPAKVEEPEEPKEVEPTTETPKRKRGTYRRWTIDMRKEFIRDCNTLEVTEVMDKWNVGTLKTLSAMKYQCKTAIQNAK